MLRKRTQRMIPEVKNGKPKKKNRKESDTEKSGRMKKDSNDRKRKKDEESSRKEGKIRASLKWFRRTKNFHTTVQSSGYPGTKKRIKKRLIINSGCYFGMESLIRRKYPQASLKLQHPMFYCCFLLFAFSSFESSVSLG